MDTWKPEQVRKIWQRVQSDHHSAPETVSPGMPAMGDLIREEWEDSRQLSMLSRKFSGQSAAILRKMAMEDQSHHTILKGIGTMTGEPPVPISPSRETIPIAAALQRIYGRKCRRAAFYQQQHNGQFSAAFEKISQQEQAHCRQLLFLLGKRKP